LPNLTHDSQNVTDLLGQPLADGDVVAWGTTFAKSAALCVAELVRIRFIAPDPTGRRRNIEVPQLAAEDYQFVLRPIKSTGSTTRRHRDTDAQETGRGPDYVPYTHYPNSGGYGRHVDYDDPTKWTWKTKTIQHVKNVVKLSLTVKEAEELSYATAG
jgi:hypothetical protein